SPAHASRHDDDARVLSLGVDGAAFEGFAGIWHRLLMHLNCAVYFQRACMLQTALRAPSAALSTLPTQEVQRCTSIQSCYRVSSSPGSSPGTSCCLRSPSE